MFVNRIGEIAERTQHHPNICLKDYKKVCISTTTHDSGSTVTVKDRGLAEEIDKVFVSWIFMDLKPGIYEHYKSGKKYRVIGMAKHSETLEDMVVYEALYENEMSKLWVRPLTMFLEEVEFEGKRIPRFKYLSEK